MRWRVVKYNNLALYFLCNCFNIMISALLFYSLFTYLFPFANVINPLFQPQVSFPLMYWGNFTYNPEKESQRNHKNIQLCLGKRKYSPLQLTKVVDLRISFSKEIFVLSKVWPWHIKQSAF